MRDLLMTEPTLYTTLMPVHRECSARKVVHCLQGAVVVVAGTREPQTEAAEKDDIIHEKVLQALDAAFTL